MALLWHSLNNEGVQGDLQSYNFLKLFGVKWKRKTKLKQIKNNPQTVATGIVRFAFTTTITLSTMLGNVRILLLSSYVGRSLVKSLEFYFSFLRISRKLLVVRDLLFYSNLKKNIPRSICIRNAWGPQRFCFHGNILGYRPLYSKRLF